MTTTLVTITFSHWQRLLPLFAWIPALRTARSKTVPILVDAWRASPAGASAVRLYNEER